MNRNAVEVVVTRDAGGVLAWQREPRYCHAARAYMNGGAAFPLPDDCFVELPCPGRSRAWIVLAAPEGARKRMENHE